MGRTKSAKTNPADEKPETPTAAEKPTSKADAARAALAEGIEAPQEAVAYIKAKFGVDMNAQHFSAFKSQLKKKEGDTTPGKRGPKPKGAVTPAKTAGGDDLIHDIASVKNLISKLGAEQVKKIVKLFE